MSDEPTYQEVGPADFVIRTGESDYQQLPAGEPLKAHIASVEKVQTPDFDDPAKMIEKASIRFEIDEGEGKGQTYTGWYTPSAHPKSKLYPLLNALYEEIPAEGSGPQGEFRLVDIIGLPLRLTLTKGREGRNGKLRQYPENFLKPASDQKPVKVKPKDVVPDEIDVDSIPF